MTIHKLREAEGLVKRLLPLARNGRYVTQEPAVEDAEAWHARLQEPRT